MSDSTETQAGAPEPMGLREASQLRILDPASLRFTPHGFELRLEARDECCLPRVRLVRIFPLSEPAQWLSVREEGGKELGVIVNPLELDPESRALVHAAIERRYLLPVVQRVLETRELFGVVNWKVETDRGPRSFTTRNLRESLVRPSSKRLLITDVDGNRYDIPDLDALDAGSQAKVTAQI